MAKLIATVVSNETEEFKVSRLGKTSIGQMVDDRLRFLATQARDGADPSAQLTKITIELDASDWAVIEAKSQ